MNKQNNFKKPNLSTQSRTRRPSSKSQSTCSLANQSTVSTTSSSSSLDQTTLSTYSNKPTSVKIEDKQLEIDLKYNEYLCAKLTHKFLKKTLNKKTDLLLNQTVQLGMLFKNLNDSKCELEIKNEASLSSQILSDKMKETTDLTTKILGTLKNQCSAYKEMLNNFTILYSLMPVNNVDLSGFNNEEFYHSLENINKSFQCISEKIATEQIIHLKETFEKIEVKNNELRKLFEECLKQLNLVASNVITTTSNEINAETTDEMEVSK